MIFKLLLLIKILVKYCDLFNSVFIFLVESVIVLKEGLKFFVIVLIVVKFEFCVIYNLVCVIILLNMEYFIEG